MGVETFIACPHCGEQFNISNDAYSQISQQIRTMEFQSELDERLSEKLQQEQLVYREKLHEATEPLEREISRLKAEVDFHKNMKLRMSTKMVGETLEQHCQIEFDKIRALAFPHAYFEKDNDARSGSKGDYIFRDIDIDTRCEILSVMFEMKNEMDDTAVKHKNEDFFKKLDSDRRQKNCKYAVLVSMLEQDSDYYNQGIVDVSHRYSDMYVIRPQFFIPFLTMLYKNAQTAFRYKQDAVILERQLKANISDSAEDLRNLQLTVDKMSDRTVKSARIANNHVTDAISQIDAIMKKLQKTRDALIKAGDAVSDVELAMSDII